MVEMTIAKIINNFHYTGVLQWARKLGMAASCLTFPLTPLP